MRVAITEEEVVRLTERRLPGVYVKEGTVVLDDGTELTFELVEELFLHVARVRMTADAGSVYRSGNGAEAP